MPGIKLVLILLKFMTYLILIIGDVIFSWKICWSDSVYAKLPEWKAIVFAEVQYDYRTCMKTKYMTSWKGWILMRLKWKKELNFLTRWSDFISFSCPLRFITTIIKLTNDALCQCNIDNCAYQSHHNLRFPFKD